MGSIKKNFIYNVIYQILLILLPIITTPYISRVLGSDGLGIYAYTYTVANYFVMASMLGVKNYGNRSIAAVREDKEMLAKTFWEIYGLQFFCAVISAAVYFCVVFFSSQDFRMIQLIQGIYMLSGLLDISWFFFGLEEFKITVLRNIVIRLVNLVCIFLFVKTRSDLWKYTLIMTLGTFCSQGYLWFYVNRLVRWYRPKKAEILKHLRSELILFIPIIAVSLYKMMDKIMLKELSTITQVGYYETSERIINIPLGVITALGTVMLPRMSSIAAKGKIEEGKKYIYNSMLFSMFMSAAMMFGIAGIAEKFVPMFLGEEYSYCIYLLCVMAPTIPFIAWANVIRMQYLIPNHEDRTYIISVILGAAVNMILNMMLIPRLNGIGAAIGTVCAEGSVCIYQTFAVRKKLEIERYLKDGLFFFVIGIGMFGVIRLINRFCTGNLIGVVLEVIIGGTIYTFVSGGYLMMIFKIRKKDLILAFNRKKKRGKEKQ